MTKTVKEIRKNANELVKESITTLEDFYQELPRRTADELITKFAEEVKDIKITSDMERCQDLERITRKYIMKAF